MCIRDRPSGALTAKDIKKHKFRTLPRCAPTTYEEWRSISGRGVAGVWKWCAVVNDFE